MCGLSAAADGEAPRPGPPPSRHPVFHLALITLDYIPGVCAARRSVCPAGETVRPRCRVSPQRASRRSARPGKTPVTLHVRMQFLKSIDQNMD